MSCCACRWMTIRSRSRNCAAWSNLRRVNARGAEGKTMNRNLLAVVLAIALTGQANAQSLQSEVDRRIAEVMPKVVQWRRDIHQHPELSNREVRTSKLVAD